MIISKYYLTQFKTLTFSTFLAFRLTSHKVQPLRQMALVCITDFQQIVEQFLFEQALKFGSKVELNQCFSEIILATVSDVSAVLKIHKEKPNNKAMITLNQCKDNMADPICQKLLILLLGFTFHVFQF